VFAKIVLGLICLQQRRLLCNNVLGTSIALVCSWRTRHCAQTLQFVQKKVPVQTFLTLCSINEVWVEHKDCNIETPSRRFKQAFKDTVMWAEFFMEFGSGQGLAVDTNVSQGLFSQHSIPPKIQKVPLIPWIRHWSVKDIEILCVCVRWLPEAVYCRVIITQLSGRNART